MRGLAWAARHGRWVLLSGLSVSVAFPALAQAMVPLILPLLAALLFLAALRIGPQAARPRGGQLPGDLATTALLQLALPLAVLGLLTALGWMHHMVAVGVVLVLAASPITGAPGLAILSGADPAPALRQVVVGTALMPLTALPVLALLPVFSDPGETLGAGLRLLALVVCSGAAAFWLRARRPGLVRVETLPAIDGAMAILMGLLVIAVTSALGPALRGGAAELWWLLALAFLLNMGGQLVSFAWLRWRGFGARAPSLAIVTGNRNMALFLPALPPDTAAAILLFVGCYQVPMFLTPLLLAPLYRRAVDSPLPPPRPG